MFVDEVIYKISCVLILESFLINTSFVEKFLQVRVHILKIEAMIRIPSNMANVLEVSWHPNILLLYLFLVSFLAAVSIRPSSEAGHGHRSRGLDCQPPVSDAMRGDPVTLAGLLPPGRLPPLPPLLPLGQLGFNRLLECCSF